MQRLLPVLALVACSGAGKGQPIAVAPRDAGSTVSASAPILRGHVFDHAGRPLAAAHVRVVAVDGAVAVEQAATGDGAFEVSLAAVTSRLVRVRLSGVDARPETLLVAPGELPADVTVRLGTHGARPVQKSYSFHVFGSGSRPDQSYKMDLQPDGTFRRVLELPDGQYAYQMMGLTPEGGPVNGSFGDGYRLDEKGDYANTFSVTGGTVAIVFDPTRRPASGMASTVTFPSHARVSEGASHVLHRYAESQRIERATTPEALRPELDEIARNDPERAVREAAAVAYFAGNAIATPTDAERGMARVLVETVKPSDPLWAQWPEAVATVLASAGGTATEAFATAFIETQADVVAVATFLLARLKSETDIVRARSLYATLMSARFNGCPWQQQLGRRYDPDTIVAVGKDVPTFDLPAVVGGKLDPKTPLTPASLRGKIYLVDVWATWCSPCVKEIPRLQELHKVYAKRGFEILSVSVDEKLATVEAFRREKGHDMPWTHAHTSETDKAIEALTGMQHPGLPFHLLVDARGKIVAVSPHLDADDLRRHLERLLPL